jgi:hypothetical protein
MTLPSQPVASLIDMPLDAAGQFETDQQHRLGGAFDQQLLIDGALRRAQRIFPGELIHQRVVALMPVIDDPLIALRQQGLRGSKGASPDVANENVGGDDVAPAAAARA